MYLEVIGSRKIRDVWDFMVENIAEEWDINPAKVLSGMERELRGLDSVVFAFVEDGEILATIYLCPAGKALSRLESSHISSLFQFGIEAKLGEFCFVGGLAVAKPYRGQGLSRRLMEAVRLTAKDRSFSSLLAVSASGTSSLEIAKLLGFIEISDVFQPRNSIGENLSEVWLYQKL